MTFDTLRYTWRFLVRVRYAEIVNWVHNAAAVVHLPLIFLPTSPTPFLSCRVGWCIPSDPPPRVPCICWLWEVENCFNCNVTTGLLASVAKDSRGGGSGSVDGDETPLGGSKGGRDEVVYSIGKIQRVLCMASYTHACTCTHTLTHTHTYLHTYTHHTYTHHAHTHTHTPHIHARTCTHTVVQLSLQSFLLPSLYLPTWTFTWVASLA